MLIGLSNPTKSRCYINSVLQLLANCNLINELNDNVSKSFHEEYCNEKNFNLEDQESSICFLLYILEKKLHNSPLFSINLQIHNTCKNKDCKHCIITNENVNALLCSTHNFTNLVDAINHYLCYKVDSKCEKCNECKRKIVTRVLTTPTYLFLNFNTINNYSSFIYDKDIIINNSTLNIDCSYSCIGFIEHTGIDNNGHYKTYINIDHENENWYLANDSYVRPITSKTIDNKLNTSKIVTMCFKLQKQ